VERGKKHGAARVLGGGLGVLKGAALGLQRGLGHRGRRCPTSVPRPRGTHPAAAGTRLGFAVEKGARRRLRYPIAEWGGARGLAGDASERGCGEREKGKGARQLGPPVVEWIERRAERAELGAERRKGKANKQAPLVSCPWWKMKGRAGAAGGLGRTKRKRKEGGLGCARVGRH
jgi:hypothetical protein